jgi:uncharacterized protein (TIGR00255 family)
MTGFGRGAASGENFAVAVEIKTVNNRFLDVHLRLSQELSPLEALIKRRVGARLSRGRVDVNVNFERTSEAAYELNRPLIAAYINALRGIKQEFGLSGEPDINALIRLPGAVQPAREGLDEAVVAGVERAVNEGA